MIDSQKALSYIRTNVFDTLGCTEPIAIAYAATAAYQHIGGDVESVHISISVNVFKNAMGVGIPGSDQRGIQFAVALGLVAGDWSKELRLLEGIDEKDVTNALALVDQGGISIALSDQDEAIYIHTTVVTQNGAAESCIRHSHSNLLYIDVDGKRVYGSNDIDCSTEERSISKHDLDRRDLKGLRMEDLVKAVDGIPENDLVFLDGVTDANLVAAEFALKVGPGMGLGRGISSLIKQGTLGKSILSTVEKYVAAAADSRMSGALIPIKGCGGSGNHGIAFFLAIGLAYNEYSAQMARSLNRTFALGLLLVQYIKGYTGLLTPTCGVTVSAAPSIAASLVYAMGGTPAQMTMAVNLVIGNIAGILCDGAKNGCALKASTSARFGVEAAFLAREGIEIPAREGIVGKDLPATYAHISNLQDGGLKDADKTMLDIMLRKAEEIENA